jgi:hypothetical protein
MVRLWKAGAWCAGWMCCVGVSSTVKAQVPGAPLPAVNPLQPSMSPAVTVRPSTSPGLIWQALGRSAEGRVIEYAQFGNGDRQILVLGPLAGDQPEGRAFVERLADHFHRFPRRLNEARVTIVRDPNPDGRMRRTAGNAHGVDLNQNFGTRDWRKVAGGQQTVGTPHSLSGREPESEPETRVLADLLKDLRPDRIVILGTSRQRPSLDYSGPVDSLVRQVTTAANIRLVVTPSAASNGSLTTFAGAERSITTVALRLAPRSSSESNWSAFKRAVLTVIETQPTPEELALVNPKPAVAAKMATPTAQPPATQPNYPASPPSPPNYVAAPQTMPVVEPRRETFMIIDSGPLVPIDPPQGLRTQPSGQPPLAQTAPPVQPVATPEVKRLPPLDHLPPSAPRNVVMPTSLPQPPIPFYPETGS